jgi:hypothetical protein
LKVKIVTGWSGPGGSTTVFINLTNYFNSKGLECTLYGPQDWHMEKCRSGKLSDLNFEEDDVLICHYLNLGQRPKVKKVLFSCHEKWWFDFSKVPIFWDKAIFLHKEHREYHSEYKGSFSIIPNIKEELHPSDKSGLDLVAGIIGAIEDRKQTHISIHRALEDGCEKVLLFGNLQDAQYYSEKVEHLLVSGKVINKGYASSKQEMYDSIGRVYHSSKGEVACLVKDECFSTGTKFFGNEETDNTVSDLSNEQIFSLWMKEIL